MLERFIVSERLGKLVEKDSVVSGFASASQISKGIELTSP
ncbi:hypothetical protein MNV_2030004 [Candidatus Methanoperedens nitroreducens]|uniref:Uncharacterized protein n=1 Tax=Candidatus Methanoperedens nitratireducens TaxID=1392998 RepID=A0A284VNH8_9EURY|nr:hypothetical protein MNV_2030004 [Candidatus Methanoperedens nitroreducens]